MTPQTDQKTASPPQRLIVVTGPSGAGRSTAINVLEDIGFEAIDNLPLSLLQRLIEGPGSGRPLAIGVDVRNRDFSVTLLAETMDWLDGLDWLDAQILFLECSEDVLVRRFSETRRRHPLAPEEAPIVGIRREHDLLAPVRAQADILIDSSDLTPHQMKARLQDLFLTDAQATLGITLQSFSYKRGVPKGMDMVFDCRFLKNPYWESALRGLSGEDAAVQDHVAGDPRYGAFVDKVSDMLLLLLPAFRDEGKAHLSVGFGCTGGQHRSVVLTETVAQRLAEAGWPVSKVHREQERWAGQGHRRDERP